MYFASSDSRYSGTLPPPSRAPTQGPLPPLCPPPRRGAPLGPPPLHLAATTTWPGILLHLFLLPPPPLLACPGTPRCPSFFHTHTHTHTRLVSFSLRVAARVAITTTTVVAILVVVDTCRVCVSVGRVILTGVCCVHRVSLLCLFASASSASLYASFSMDPRVYGDTHRRTVCGLPLNAAAAGSLKAVSFSGPRFDLLLAGRPA